MASVVVDASVLVSAMIRPHGVVYERLLTLPPATLGTRTERVQFVFRQLTASLSSLRVPHIAPSNPRDGHSAGQQNTLRLLSPITAGQQCRGMKISQLLCGPADPNRSAGDANRKASRALPVCHGRKASGQECMT